MNFKNNKYALSVLLGLIIALSFLAGTRLGFIQGANYMLEKNIFMGFYCKEIDINQNRYLPTIELYKEIDDEGNLSNETYIYEDDKYKIVVVD